MQIWTSEHFVNLEWLKLSSAWTWVKTLSDEMGGGCVSWPADMQTARLRTYKATSPSSTRVLRHQTNRVWSIRGHSDFRAPDYESTRALQSFKASLSTQVCRSGSVFSDLCQRCRAPYDSPEQTWVISSVSFRLIQGHDHSSSVSTVLIKPTKAKLESWYGCSWAGSVRWLTAHYPQIKVRTTS